jgi:hypothetical protein
VAVGSQLAQRGLAEYHCAGVAQTPDDLRVGGCGLRVATRAVCGHLAGHVDHVLHRHGHSQQGTSLACLEAGQRCVSVGERGFGAHRDEGVQRRVEPLDPRQEELGQLSRRHLAGAEQLA